MNRRELSEYHSELAGILKSEPDRSKWKEFLAHERTTQEYKSAKEQVASRNSVGDLPNEDRTEQLIDKIFVAMFGELTPQERTTIGWANQAQEEYNNLLKQTSRERAIKKLIAQTAGELLKNPQDIFIAHATWRGNELSRDGAEKPQEPFSKKVKEKMLKLMADNWDKVTPEQLKVTPEQLAELVRIYANKDESQESARESAEGLLRNYFKGPKSRSEKIDAYYKFVSGVLDLAEEDEAFKEGMKIALHATTLLPMDGKLAEQIALVYFPYNVEREDLRKRLVSTRVVARAYSMGGWGLEKQYQEWRNFLLAGTKTKEARYMRRQSFRGKKTEDELQTTFNLVENSLRFILDSNQEYLIDDNVVVPEGTLDPLVFAFDPADPLSQKFEKVLCQRAASKISPDTLKV